MRTQRIAPRVGAVLAAFCLGCSSDDETGAQLRSSELALGGVSSSGQGGAQADPPRVPTPQCALDYSACLVRNPFDVLPCTAKAEECGLFIAAADGGVVGLAGAPAPATTSPTCALKIATCVVRDPFRATQCPSTACK